MCELVFLLLGDLLGLWRGLIAPKLGVVGSLVLFIVLYWMDVLVNS